MQIARHPAFGSSTRPQGEGPARLNRYALTFNVLRGLLQLERRAVPTFSELPEPAPGRSSTNP
jgi:hypothetical protein